jgi:hypothetical protein
VPAPSPKAPPDLSRECPDAVDDAVLADIRRALRERHADRLGVDSRGVAEHLDIDAMTGSARNAGAAVAVAVTGTIRRAHEVFVFARDGGVGHDLDGALGVVVDTLDALLEELVGADDAFLPLDWEGRPDGKGGVVFVRGEVRDYVAEEEAAKMLGEDTPERAIPGFPRQ